MTTHITTTRDKWLEARRDLVAAEKELTRHSDEVARLRRQLPWVRVEKKYVFEGLDGPVTLADLFEGRSQLIAQQFMLAPGWQEGCKSCSFMADHTDGMIIHLAHRDVTMVAISRAPLAEVERFRQRMGWRFNWVSSYGSDFNYDFGVSFTPDQMTKGKIDYNFGDCPLVGKEWPGVSVFCKDDLGDVFHTYSTYGRGVEVMMGTYRLLDLTPKGRDEQAGRNMAWVRHHDRYELQLKQTVPDASSSCSARA
jgi:predicted dithiol-disulfide oxidoreductase (DUF899 family)